MTTAPRWHRQLAPPSRIARASSPPAPLPRPETTRALNKTNLEVPHLEMVVVAEAFRDKRSRLHQATTPPYCVSCRCDINRNQTLSRPSSPNPAPRWREKNNIIDVPWRTQVLFLYSDLSVLNAGSHLALSPRARAPQAYGKAVCACSDSSRNISPMATALCPRGNVLYLPYLTLPSYRSYR